MTRTARRLTLVFATATVLSVGSLGAVRAATPAQAPVASTPAAATPAVAVCAGLVLADVGICL